MKVLFISSGKKGVVGDVVRNQGESLQKAGIEVNYFLIKPGVWGYISSIPKIRKAFKKGKYDIAHAHYSFSAFAASLAGRFPLVVSLMGSDVYMSTVFRFIAWLFIRFRWTTIIVKNVMLKEWLNITNAHVIPNGVNLMQFKPMSMSDARQHLSYHDNKKVIAFISHQNGAGKNFSLAKEAVTILNNASIEFKHIYNIPNKCIPYYLNASNLLLLTSQWEGSPNIIKEAMACNCPVVATDVGDIRWLFGNEPGHFLTGFDPEDVAEKILAALEFVEKNGRTEGRQRIIDLDLDSDTIAKRIIALYIQCLKGKSAINMES